MVEGSTKTRQELGTLRAHQILVSRIVNRAQLEGCSLSPLELKQFESDRLTKDEYRKFAQAFEQETTWQVFLEKISGILRRAMAEDTQEDPTAPARYEELVHQLEGQPESFSLWACCVPAIPGYKSNRTTSWLAIALILAAILVVLVVLIKYR